MNFEISSRLYEMTMLAAWLIMRKLIANVKLPRIRIKWVAHGFRKENVVTRYH